MSDTPKTDAAMDALDDREDVKSFREGSNATDFLTPKDMLDLRELEVLQAIDNSRANSGLHRQIVD